MNQSLGTGANFKGLPGLVMRNFEPHVGCAFWELKIQREEKRLLGAGTCLCPAAIWTRPEQGPFCSDHQEPAMAKGKEKDPEGLPQSGLTLTAANRLAPEKDNFSQVLL